MNEARTSTHTSLLSMISSRARQLLGLMLLLMVALNFANALGRYVIGWAIPGSDEILVFAMVWLVFSGAVLVTASGQHLGFPALMQRLSHRSALLLGALIALATAVLAGFIAVQSLGVIEQLYRIGQTSMAAQIPMPVPHAAVFVSFALIAAITLLQGFSKLRAWWRGVGLKA